MVTILRTLTALSGLGLLVFGLGWWVHPAAAADMLGASLLDGTGRTTQIGDSGAFFVGAGSMLVGRAAEGADFIDGEWWSGRLGHTGARPLRVDPRWQPNARRNHCRVRHIVSGGGHSGSSQSQHSHHIWVNAKS